MPTAYLVDSLVSLRTEINRLAPDRDKASDGWIGDAAHASGQSDHNPDDKGAVHAIDVDRDLRLPGWTMERLVQFILARCRSGAEKRLKYIIFDGRIWSRSWGWTERDYTGSNPHDKHAHFSARYESVYENDDSDWALWEAEMAERNEEEMEFWESAARAANNDPSATATDRNNRNNAAAVIRFALGLEKDERTDANLPAGPGGMLDRILMAVTGAAKSTVKKG